MINNKSKLPARRDVYPTFWDETGDNEYNSNSSKLASNVSWGWRRPAARSHQEATLLDCQRQSNLLHFCPCGLPRPLPNIPLSKVQNDFFSLLHVFRSTAAEKSSRSCDFFFFIFHHNSKNSNSRNAAVNWTSTVSHYSCSVTTEERYNCLKGFCLERASCLLMCWLMLNSEM